MSKHVVIVEDEKELAASLKTSLEEEGFRATVIHDGDKATEMIEQVLPDVILMDVMLPGEFGQFIAGHLRQKDQTKHIPIIFLTNLSQMPELEEMKEHEKNVDYFVKVDTPLSEVLARVKHYTK